MNRVLKKQFENFQANMVSVQAYISFLVIFFRKNVFQLAHFTMTVEYAQIWFFLLRSFYLQRKNKRP